MRKYFNFIVFICLILLSGCTTKAPVIHVSTETIVLQARDSDFSYAMLYEHIQAEDGKGNIIQPEDLSYSGEVDLHILGNYEVVVTASKKEKNTSAVINVEVVDTVQPILQTTEKEIVVLQDSELDLTATNHLISAYDEYDGLISDRITYTGEVDTSKVQSYPVVYRVKDKSGNISESTVTYRVTNSKEEYADFLYERAKNIYWGKYFMVDQILHEGMYRILNYEEVVENAFTAKGKMKFINDVNDEDGSINIVQKEDGIYLNPNKQRSNNTNYLSTSNKVIFSNKNYIQTLATSTYGDGKQIVDSKEEKFYLVRINNIWLIDQFVLPN